MSFPINPNDNDIVERFGRRFRYKSSKGAWDIISSPIVAPTVEAAPTTSSVAQAVNLPMSGNEIGAMSYVQESNRLYVWNGSGWFEIALVNTNPTITAGGQATYELNSDGTPTVITLAANDPEEVPLTWSYAVSSGALEDTTITNEGAVFTITPGETAATFDLTFTASDGINIDTSTSAFTLSFGVDAEILLVGGGGAGGNGHAVGGGGGGGGGVIHDTSARLDFGTTYPIVVGLGAARYAATNQFSATIGQSTTAFGYTALGGGTGGQFTSNDQFTLSSTGGSGGGGSGNGITISPGTINNSVQQLGSSGTPSSFPVGNTTAVSYQNAGGNGIQWMEYTNRRGGGGGGAGTAGGNGTDTATGSGGNGIPISITGSSVYYAGGGAGGYRGAGVTEGTGGLGGGGNANSPGTNGLGGGGGGVIGDFANVVRPVTGGSGVVIIRTLATATATTGNPTITTDGAYNIYKFLTNGSITF